MMRYTQSILLDADGLTRWRGPYSSRAEAVAAIDLCVAAGRDALGALCGMSSRADGSPWVPQRDLSRLARQLKLVGAEGTAPGFVFLPPPGVALERSVQAFNREHLSALEAVEILFPLVFDHTPADIRDLTHSYAAQERLFRIADHDRDLRLSYAADPHLFSWLRGRQLRADLLPYTIVSDTAVLRRFRSGELGPLNRVMQYSLPDVHILVQAASAREALVRAVALAAEATRFWASDAYVQFIDMTEAFMAKQPVLAGELARAAGKPTLINIFETRPRYYAMRSGLMPDAGTGALMLYNFQWDDENPSRFQITVDDGSELVVLHTNAATGSGILCLALGRALAKLASPEVPVELASVQVALQPLTDRHCSAAEVHRTRLARAGLRVAVEQASGPLGKALQRHAARWMPFVAVVGDREAGEGRLILQSGKRERLTEEEFFTRYATRLARCAWDNGCVVRPLPLVDTL